MLSIKNNRMVLLLSATIVIALIAFALLRDDSQSASLDQIAQLVQQKKITNIVQSGDLYYMATADDIYRIPVSQVSPRFLQNYSVEIRKDNGYLFYTLLIVIALGGLSYGVRYVTKMKTGNNEQAFGMQSASTDGDSQVITPVESDVTFDDIGGISDVKEELQEIIDFLQNSARFKTFGARMPRGVLLVGPPGVGKTMIAKAVAAEAGVPFYYQSAASFVQIYVGMGAKRVHELFAAAKNNAPSIIFIDEIDAVGKERDGNRSDEREATLNQLLTEMDGFEDSSGVIVVAATNKIEVLDSALLRAGRFDRRVFVELPTPQERASILNKYIAKVPNSLKVDEIVTMTIGFNGASLATLVNEAALLALRQKESEVSMEHFYAVKDKVAYGKKKLAILSEKQKQYRARYLASKSVLAYLHELPFEKAMLSSETIKPQLGTPMIQGEIEGYIKVLLAGMAGCDLHFKEHATNVVTDLTLAKKLAGEMSEKYGMGQGLMPETAEVVSILEALYLQSRELLEKHMPAVERIEAVLIEDESITKERIAEIVG